MSPEERVLMTTEIASRIVLKAVVTCDSCGNEGSVPSVNLKIQDANDLKRLGWSWTQATGLLCLACSSYLGVKE